VGMNRYHALLPHKYRCVPHVCGDEPLPGDITLHALRVPHVCGDEPAGMVSAAVIRMCSPRVWG